MKRKPTTPTEPTTSPDQGGRPSKYLPQFAAAAAKLCKLGATDRDLAEAFAVAESTVKSWRLEHADFADAVKLGKEAADNRVEESLYRRATGYSHDAVKIIQFDGAPCSVPYVEHYPPDTVACIFWLKNRKPDQWRDKIDILATVRPADVTAEPLKPDEWDREYGSGRAN